jgi:mannose-6-phosphate isomerase-like protein (cupin superfamily)
VLKGGDTFTSSSGSGFTVIEGPADNNGARIVFERVMPPGKGKADPHVHLDCDQHYEVLSGAATFEISGTTRTLAGGETADVPRVTPHRDPYNRSTSELRFRVAITPCPPFIDAFGRALAEGYQSGALNTQDELPILKILVLARAFDGQSYRAGLPIGVQKALLPAAAGIGRLLGHRVPSLAV